MNNQLLRVARWVVLGATLWMPSSAPAEDLAVFEVLRELKNQIHAAQRQSQKSPRLRIDSVELELATVVERAGDAGIGVYVVEASGDYADKSINRISLQFRPKGDVPVSGAEYALAQAVETVRAAVRATLNQPPRLELIRFRYEFEMEVERNAEGGINVSVANLGLRGAAGTGETSSHKIAVELVAD